MGCLLKWQFKNRYIEEIIDANNCGLRSLQRKGMGPCGYSANHQATSDKWFGLGHVVDAAKDVTCVTIVQLTNPSQ